jgi:hypothetical protein
LIEETELKFYTDKGLGGRVEKEYNQNPKWLSQSD